MKNPPPIGNPSPRSLELCRGNGRIKEVTTSDRYKSGSKIMDDEARSTTLTSDIVVEVDLKKPQRRGLLDDKHTVGCYLSRLGVSGL